MENPEKLEKIQIDEKLKKRGFTFGSIIHSVFREIIEFKGWEILFRIVIVAFLCWGVYAVYLAYLFHHDPTFADVPKYSVYDFKYSLFPTLFFFVYKRTFLHLFYDRLKKSLNPAKFITEEDRHMRATKNCVWLSCIIYYTFTSILAYILFNGAFFFPGYLGGAGQCSDLYKYTPYAVHIPYAKAFYQLQFGWHFHTLIDHVVYKWKDQKFWEMFLHHTVAVFLIFFSYVTNQVPVGILVLVTHDPCDIGLYFGRFYDDRTVKNKVLLYGQFAVFVFAWIYLRLFVFPKCVVGQAYHTFFTSYINNPDLMYSIYLYMIVMMTSLVILHFYWFMSIARIITALLMRKKEPNAYDNGNIGKSVKKN